MRSMAALAALVCASCALADHGSPRADGSVYFPSDGSFTADAGGPASDAGGVVPATPEYRGDDPGYCYDGMDNDSAFGTDCNDLSCLTNLRACCVANTLARCCSALAPLDVTFATCSVGDVSPCLPTARVFGESVPQLETEGSSLALITRGQMRDTGFALAETIDPRASSITLTARIAARTSSCAGCMDAMAVGLLDANDPLIGTLEPIAAVVVSSTRGEIALTLAGQVARRWRLPDEEPHTYVLELQPDGTLTLGADDVALAEVSDLVLEGAVVPVVYGRAPNPGPDTPTPARLLSLRLERSACDIPAVVSRSARTIVPAPGEPSDWATPIARIRGASVLRYESLSGVQTRMVLEIDGEIHLARPGAEGFVLQEPVGSPALSAVTDTSARDGVSDPELVYDGDHLALYFTGWDNGRGTILRVDASGSEETFDGSLAQPVAVALAPYASFDAATLFDAGATRRMIVRARTNEGATFLVPMVRDVSLERWSAGAPILQRSADFAAFDRDEVAAPAVVQVAGVYRLYYAGRSGTHWSVGVLVSDDAGAWRRLPDPVLGASGGAFDALGATDPSPIVLAGQLIVYYTGDDGARTRVGAASAPVPTAP